MLEECAKDIKDDDEAEEEEDLVEAGTSYLLQLWDMRELCTGVSKSNTPVMSILQLD